MAINFLAQLPIGTTATNIGPLDMVITMLQNFGFFRVILPFLLVFSLVYAVLNKTKILGDPKDSSAARTASAVIGLVSAFLVIVYTPVVEAISTLLPQAAFLIIVVVLILMILGLFGVNMENFAKEPNKWLIILGLIVAGLFVIMVGAAVGPSVPALYTVSQFAMGAIPITGEIPAETVALLAGVVIIVGIVAGVIYMVTKD